MDNHMRLDAHLFVCTNKRENGACCANHGGETLHAQLKEKCATLDPRWKNHIRVNASGCLGHCNEGGVAVLYPKGRWFTELSTKNAEELFDCVKETLGETEGDPA